MSIKTFLVKIYVEVEYPLTPGPQYKRMDEEYSPAEEAHQEECERIDDAAMDAVEEKLRQLFSDDEFELEEADD